MRKYRRKPTPRLVAGLGLKCLLRFSMFPECLRWIWPGWKEPSSNTLAFGKGSAFQPISLTRSSSSPKLKAVALSSSSPISRRTNSSMLMTPPELFSFNLPSPGFWWSVPLAFLLYYLHNWNFMGVRRSKGMILSYLFLYPLEKHHTVFWCCFLSSQLSNSQLYVRISYGAIDHLGTECNPRSL